jgi:hypothetical protein
VVYTTLEELSKVEVKAWEEDEWWKYTSSLRWLWMRGETLYSGWDNEALGVDKTESLEDVVRGAVELAKKR